MSKTVKVLVPMDIDPQLLKRQLSAMHEVAESVRSGGNPREDYSTDPDLIEGVVSILEAIVDEVQQ